MLDSATIRQTNSSRDADACRLSPTVSRADGCGPVSSQSTGSLCHNPFQVKRWYSFQIMHTQIGWYERGAKGKTSTVPRHSRQGFTCSPLHFSFWSNLVSLRIGTTKVKSSTLQILNNPIRKQTVMEHSNLKRYGNSHPHLNATRQEKILGIN